MLKKNHLIAVTLAPIFMASSFICGAYAMSVTLKNGEAYKAETVSERENAFKIEKNGTKEIVLMSDIKNIDFSSEDSKTSPGGEKTASVELSGIAPDVKAILDKVPDKSKFPNAGGIIIKDEDIYTMNQDGTHKVRSHYIFKIYEDRAIDSGITAGYAFERETAKIVMARTIGEDGKTYDVDPKDIKEGDMFRGAQFYSNTYKIISATLPNVKKGSIIEYIIETNVFKPMIEDYFTPAIYFGSYEPVLERRLEIHMPKSKKLKWVAKNFDRIYDKNFESIKSAKDPKITEKGNETIYVFEASNIPEIIREPNMPPIKDVVARVQCSAYENWDKIYEWDIKNLGSNIDDVSDEMKKKVAELTGKCKTNDEKVAAIYHYVQQEIRYISIKGDTVAGRAGHPAKQIFENKYGDCTDKSVLMASFLKLCGIKSYPAALKAGEGDWDSEVAHIDSNHKISFLMYDSKEIFLDSTSQNTRFPFFRADDHGRNCLVSQDRRMVRAGMPLSVVKSSREVVIKSDASISVSGKREFSGHFESSIRGRNKSMKENEIKDEFKRRLNQTLPGVNLKSLSYTDLMDLTKPVVETVEYEAPDAVIIAGNLMLFAIPGNESKFPEASLKTRNYPIDYSYLVRDEVVYNFSIPAEYVIKYLPAKFEVDNKYISYKSEYTNLADGRICYSEALERKLRMVDPADYESYKKDLESITKHSGEKAVAEKLK